MINCAICWKVTKTKSARNVTLLKYNIKYNIFKKNQKCKRCYTLRILAQNINRVIILVIIVRKHLIFNFLYLKMSHERSRK